MSHHINVGAFKRANNVVIDVLAPALEGCALLVRKIYEQENEPSLYDMHRCDDGILRCELKNFQRPFLYKLALPCGAQAPDPFAQEVRGDVHGWSYVDPALLEPRTPHPFHGVPIEKAVIMEIHIGAFTPEGTFSACASKLDYLSDLGVNVIQLMPIWNTPGTRNWGYDPVSFFTLNPDYGSLGDLFSLVEKAHKIGIAVVIDCVYNHLGPEGCYLPMLCDGLLSKTNQTPWGASIDLDAETGKLNRSMILASLKYLMNYIGVDGVRIDAGEHLRPDNSVEFLLLIAAHARKWCKHETPLIILEHDLQTLTDDDRRQLFHADGFDGVWNSALTPDDIIPESASPTATFDIFVRAMKILSGNTHANDLTTSKLEATNFITFLRSHDTIGNEGHNTRDKGLPRRIIDGLLKILLLSPTTPMFFMGDERGDNSPFYFFCEYNDIDEDVIQESRKREFASMSQTAPTPFSSQAFTDSKISWCTNDSNRTLSEIKNLIGIRNSVVVDFAEQQPVFQKMKVDHNRLSAEISWMDALNRTLTLHIFAPDTPETPEPIERNTFYSAPVAGAEGEPLRIEASLS